jgi:uroporphyrinogen decarboxylase
VKRTAIEVAAGDSSETYMEVAESPLGSAASIDDIENYGHWPSPDWFDYSVIKEQCSKIRNEDRIAVFMGDRLNRVAQLKPAMYMRGDVNMFMDLVSNPDLAMEIINRIKSFYMEYLQRILEAADGAIDIVLTGDDFGSQNGMLISPEMWKEYLQPGFKEYLALAKSYGVKTMHHTCGSVADIIPEIIGSGLDILQSIQPEAANMTLKELREKYHGQICFQGGISIQKTITFGSPEDIKQEVKGISEVIKPDGGYIFCTSHNIQADAPLDNVTALMEAYSEYGTY